MLRNLLPGDLGANRDFLGLLTGRIITNLGDSLYIIAAMWLVHDLTSSPFYTGVAGFMVNLPKVLQFLTGPLVDRLPIRELLVAIQVIQAVLVLIIPVAAMNGLLSVWLVIALIPTLAMLNQFVYPAQNAALPRIVAEDDLTQANSLFSFSYKGIDILGQALGGLLVAIIGAVAIYAVNSVTFFLTAACFMLVTVPPVDSDETDEGNRLEQYGTDLKEGIDYVWNSLLRYIVASALIANFALGVSFAILPAFADLYGGSNLYGFLMASVSAGILGGAILASKFESYPFSRVQAFLFGVGTILWLTAVLTDHVWLTVVVFGFAWIPVGVYNVMIQTVRQTAAPKELIGRVTSVAVSGSALAAPIGSLSGGAIAEVIGPELTMAGVSICFLPVIVMFGFHPRLRGLPALSSITPEDVVIPGSQGQYGDR